MQKPDTIACADAIATLKGKFVAVERFTVPRGLAWPGGKVDKGETVEQAAEREFFGETGLSLAIDGKVGYYDRADRDPRGHYSSDVFHGHASGTPRAETGKTRVLLLSEEEVQARRAEFVADHYQMFIDRLNL